MEINEREANQKLEGKGALRVGFWGAFAMALTAGIGAWFGAIV